MTRKTAPKTSQSRAKTRQTAKQARFVRWLIMSAILFLNSCQIVNTEPANEHLSPTIAIDSQSNELPTKNSPTNEPTPPIIPTKPLYTETVNEQPPLTMDDLQDDELLANLSSAIEPTPLIEPTKPQNYAVPDINHDVIFLIGGVLQRWQHETNELETLAAPNILEYSLSEDGRQLVVAKQIGFDPDSYELISLDLRNNRSQVIVENNHCLHDFAISPDGTRLLYIADNWNPDEQQCQAEIEREGETLWTFSPPFSNVMGGTVYIADIDGDMETAVVGHCNSTISGDVYISQFVACTTAYWTVDSQNIIWFDAEGVWLTNLTSNQPTMLYPLFQDDEDRIYKSVAWSPSGKYLMMRGNSLSGNESRRLTINWQTGQVVEAPYADNGYYGMGVHPRVVWANDDTLFVTKDKAVAEIWKFAQDGSAFVLENELSLTSPDSVFVASSPHQLSDGTLTYALLSPGITNEQERERGIYTTTSLSHDPKRIIGLPRINGYASDAGVLWSPNENEAIIIYNNSSDEGGFEKQFYYISNSSDILYNITQTLGETAEDIQWLP